MCLSGYCVRSPAYLCHACTHAGTHAHRSAQQQSAMCPLRCAYLRNMHRHPLSGSSTSATTICNYHTTNIHISICVWAHSRLDVVAKCLLKGFCYGHNVCVCDYFFLSMCLRHVARVSRVVLRMPVLPHMSCCRPCMVRVRLFVRPTR